MKIVITVPGHLTAQPAIEDAIDALVKLAGGVTVCPAQGRWIDPDGRTHIEPVEQYHFCFIGGEEYIDYDAINAAERDVVAKILHAGEHAVLVEYHRARAYNCVIYTLGDIES